MQTEQRIWTAEEGWQPTSAAALSERAQLVFVFGAPALLRDARHIAAIRGAYPQAHVIGCSTAGEIYGASVADDSLVATALYFEATPLAVAKVGLSAASDSFSAGQRLADMFSHADLAHVLVLSDGTDVNGSELVSGLTAKLPARVAITGGLAGDGPRFGETLVCLDGPAEPGVVAAVGFYGRHIQIGYGSVGGWEAFGPERTITRSEGNVLYEIDGQSALALYKEHLGEHASGLPASGLLFPLNVRRDTREIGVVRTILGTSEERQSITFAGDVPQGRHTRLMRSSFDRMIAAAAQAAYASRATLDTAAPELAILISCIGRKLLLKQRIAEEVESVRAVLGDKATLAGFYSYGEISPFGPTGKCELHNQTLTITTFSEQLDRTSLGR